MEVITIMPEFFETANKTDYTKKEYNYSVICQNARKLIKIAKQYDRYDVTIINFHSTLAREVIHENPRVLKRIPSKFVEELTELYNAFLKIVLPENVENNTEKDRFIFYLYTLFSETYKDYNYKSCIPFTNLYNITQYQHKVDKLLTHLFEFHVEKYKLDFMCRVEIIPSMKSIDANSPEYDKLLNILSK